MGPAGRVFVGMLEFKVDTFLIIPVYSLSVFRFRGRRPNSFATRADISSTSIGTEASSIAATFRFSANFSGGMSRSGLAAS